MTDIQQQQEQPFTALKPVARASSASPGFETGIQEDWEDSSFDVPMYAMFESSGGGDDVPSSVNVKDDTLPPLPPLQLDQLSSTSANENSSNGSGEKRVAAEAITMMPIMPTISRRRKKPKGMPKRGLSAYNLYFQCERQRMMEDTSEEGGSKLSFEELGKIIGKRWRELPLPNRKVFEELAAKDSARYRKEMEVFNEEKKKKILHFDCGEAKLNNNNNNNSAEEVFYGSPPAQQQQQEEEEEKQLSYLPSDEPLYPPGVEAGMQATRSYSPGRSGQKPPVPQQHYGLPSYPPANGGYVASTAAVAAGQGDRSSPRYPPPMEAQYYHPPSPVVVTASENGRPSPVSRASSEMVPPVQQQRPHPQAYHQNVYPPRHHLFPIPPGMELMLPDRDGRERKYRVEYQYYRMTRHEAQEYMDRLSGVISHHMAPPAPTAPAADANQEGRFGKMTGVGYSTQSRPRQPWQPF